MRGGKGAPGTSGRPGRISVPRLLLPRPPQGPTPITGVPNSGTGFGFRKLCLVHLPAAGTLPDADTAGMPGGAGRRPSPVGRRPPGQVPACQALPDLVCRDSAGSESPAATRPSSFVLVSCSIPQGDSNGGIAAPSLRRFKKGPGGKHRVPAAAQGSAEANCPEGAKEAPLGVSRRERAEQRKE